MALHYQFYEELDNEEYVTRDSILSCIYGTNNRKLDLLLDHGVKAPTGQYVATCKDCKVGENIHNFGICRCPVPADMPERERIAIMLPVDETGKQYITTGQKCMPVFKEEWQQVHERTMTYVKDGGTYEVTLTNKATLVCKYGGWITIEEVPEETVEPEEFFIAPWLVGYKGKPSAAGGKSVTYSFEDRQKVKEEVKPDMFDWYSYENRTEKNRWCKKYLEGQEFINSLLIQNMLKENLQITMVDIG